MTWQAPLEGTEREYWICVGIPGRIPLFDDDCGRASVGERYHTFTSGFYHVFTSKFYHVFTGGTYQIRVTHRSLPVETVERTVYASQPAAEKPIEARRAPTPSVTHRGWHHESAAWWMTDRPDGPDAAMFVVSWSDEVGAELAEIEWEVGGRRFFRQTTEQSMILDVDTRDSIPFRIRYLQEGVWTRWSEAVVPSLVPSRPFRVWIDEYEGNLVIDWAESSRLDILEGYRVYVSRDGGEEEVLEVGREQSVVYPMDPDGMEYNVGVTSYNSDGEESKRRWETYKRGAPLAARLSHWGDGCIRGAAGEIEVVWFLEGGAGPFLVAIDDAAAFATSTRGGKMLVPCDAAGDAAAATERTVEVYATDYYDQAASRTLVVGYAEPESPPPPLPPLELWNLRSVHQTYVWLRWRCDRRAARADVLTLRWRSEASEAWRYVSADDFPQEVYPDGLCCGQWLGLDPLTRYEFQVARYDDPTELGTPELLAWTRSETVTTTGPAVDVRVAPHEAGLEVSWQSQPDAWGYQVIVSAVNKSWWTFHRPNGEAVERVILRGVKGDAEYAIEIITPPHVDGEEQLARSFAYVEVLGH